MSSYSRYKRLWPPPCSFSPSLSAWMRNRFVYLLNCFPIVFHFQSCDSVVFIFTANTNISAMLGVKWVFLPSSVTLILWWLPSQFLAIDFKMNLWTNRVLAQKLNIQTYWEHLSCYLRCWEELWTMGLIMKTVMLMTRWQNDGDDMMTVTGGWWCWKPW